MSGACFRGRGFGPRGARPTVPTNAFSGPRIPHPNFNRAIPPPNRLPGLENWSDRPPGFPPWQSNSKFPPRPQYRGNLHFRFNGRGRTPNGPATNRFMGPVRPPVPQFSMGVRGRPRPPPPPPPPPIDHLQDKSPLLPQVPLLGSKEERQQKISETADKLKQKLSSITEEELSHFWEDDFSVLPSDGSDAELVQNKGIPELRHVPPELDFTFIDFRDMGRVDSSDPKFNGLGNAIDEDDVIITFAGETTHDIENMDDEITFVDEIGTQSVQTLECTNDSVLLDVPAALLNSTACEENQSCTISIVSGHTNKSDDSVATVNLALINSETPVKNVSPVISEHNSNNVIDIHTVINEVPVHPSDAGTTPTSISVPQEQRITPGLNVPHKDVLQLTIEENKNSIEEKQHSSQTTQQTNNSGDEGCQTSSTACISTQSKTTQVPSNSLYVPPSISQNLQTTKCFNYEGTHPSNGDKITHDSENTQASFNGTHRFHPKIHPWMFQQNNDNSFVAGTQRLPCHNQPPPARPHVPFSQTTFLPAAFDPRAPPPFTNKVPPINHDRQFHPVPSYSPNDLPPNFDPSEPPPNMRSQTMPRFAASNEALQRVSPFSTGCQTPLVNVPQSNINLCQPPPEFDPREPPPRATTVTPAPDNLPYFNCQQAPPKLYGQEGPVHSPASFNSQHSSQDNSTLTAYTSSPNGCTASSASLTVTSHSMESNINVALSQSPLLTAAGAQMTYQPAETHNNAQKVNTDELDGLSPTICSLQHSVNMVDGLEDMQEAMEFANEAMSMNDKTNENNCAIATAFPDVPVSEIPVPNENLNFPQPTGSDHSGSVKKSPKECKSNKTEQDVASGSEPVVEEQSVVEKSQDSQAKNMPLIDEQTRPKVIFNLNSKSKRITKPGEWYQRSDERRGRKQKVFAQRNIGNRAIRTEDKVPGRRFGQRKNHAPRIQQKERSSVPDNTQRVTIAETITSENSESHNAKSQTQSSSTLGSNAGIPRARRLRRPPRKIEVPKSENSWKDRVIRRFLKMSKNDICNMVNNSSLRKFDIAMKHLVKEKRSSLSLEMRKTENEKMKCYDRDEFMTQLNAMLDPGAVVDITNLPTEFIHHLSEVLQLDPMPFDSELCLPPDLEIVDLGNAEIIDPIGQASLLDKSLEELIEGDITDSNINVESAGHSEPQNTTEQIVDTVQDISKNDESRRMHVSPTQDPSPSTTCTASQSHATFSPKESNPDKPQTEIHQKRPLFNTSDLDDILSVVTEKSKKTSSSLSLCETKSDALNASSKNKPDTSTWKETSPQVPHGENAEQVNASLSDISKASLPSRTLESETTRSRKSNSEDRYTFRRGRYDRWSRKVRENPDKFRNLTKEEWEAKHGRRNATSTAFFVSRRSNSSNTDKGSRTGHRNCHSRRYFSDSPARRSSASPVTREPVVHESKRHWLKRQDPEESHPPERACSESEPNRSSSSESESEPVDTDVTKLLKVIKEKEKIAKNRSLNETIRDEVAAEIQRKWREKGRHRDRKSHKHDRRRRDRKAKRKRFKKKKKRRTFESSTPESAEQTEEHRLLTGSEIKSEVIIKEEPNVQNNISRENETANVPAVLLSNNETIAAQPVHDNGPENVEATDQPAAAIACGTVQTEVKSKSTCTAASQPKTKAQLKQISEPSSVHQKPIAESSKELPIDSANAISANDGNKKANNKSETTKKVVSAQTGEDIPMNNNSLHQTDLPLDNAKLTAVEDNSVRSKSMEPVALNASITVSEANIPNQRSEKDANVPGTKESSKISAPHVEKPAFTEEAVNNITTRLEVVGGKSGCKKIDIKEYKERALQRWLKEQERLKELRCPMSRQQQGEHLSNVPIIKPPATDVRPTDVNTEQQRLTDLRQVKKDKPTVATSQEASIKETEEKTQSEPSGPPTDVPQKRKEGVLRLRSINDLSGVRFKERNIAKFVSSEPAVDGSAKCKASEKRSQDSRGREESKLRFKETDIKKAESAGDLPRFKNIRSECGKELKLKNETMKRLIDRRKRPRVNQSKPTVLSIKKVHLPKNLTLGTQKPLAKEILEPVHESANANKDICSINSEPPQVENPITEEAQISRTDETAPLIASELNDSVKDQHNNEPKDTQSTVHFSTEHEFTEIKECKNDDVADHNRDATQPETLNAADQSGFQSEERASVSDEINIKDHPVCPRDHENMDLKSDHVFPVDMPKLNEAEDASPPETKARLAEVTLGETTLDESVLPVEEEGAKEGTLQSDGLAEEAIPKDVNDIKSNVSNVKVTDTEICADVRDSNNAKDVDTNNVDADELPERISTGYLKSVAHKNFEVNCESSPDSPRIPFKGFVAETVDDIYDASAVSLNFRPANDGLISKNTADEMSFGSSSGLEKIPDETKMSFADEKIRGRRFPVSLELNMVLARLIENHDQNSSSSELSATNEARVEQDENSTLTRTGALRIKTRDINELLRQPKSTVLESENSEAVPEYRNEDELLPNLEIARSGQFYPNENSEFVPPNFPILSRVPHEDNKNVADYHDEKSCVKEHGEKSIAAQTFSSEEESFAQKDAWENIVTCLIPLSKSQLPNTADTITQVSFNIPPSCSISRSEGLSDPAVESDLQTPLEREPEKPTEPFANDPPEISQAEAVEPSDKSLAKEAAQESSTANSTPIEPRKTEQKNLHHGKPLEVAKNFESFNRIKTDTTRSGVDVPKRLNVPTKAALKESVENLFIPSSYASGETKIPNSVKTNDATTSRNDTTKSSGSVPTESEHRAVNSTSSKLNSIEKSGTVTHSSDATKSGKNSIHQNPVVELEKLKGLDALVGRKQSSTERTDSNVEPETRRKSSKKRESDSLHKVRNKPKMKHTKEKERGVKPGLTQIASGSSKEDIMARMIEIDVEIHKLMTEKMTLYQRLENNVFPTESSSQADSTTHESADDVTSSRPRTPSALMSQLIQNIEVNPVMSVQAPGKGTAESTPSKSNTDSTQCEKQRTPSKSEHASRKRSSVSRSSEEDEVTSHSENARTMKKRKKGKLERVVKWEDTSEASAAVHEASAKRKQHSESTRSILKKVNAEARQEASEQSNVLAREETEKRSSVCEKKAETCDQKNEANAKSETTDGRRTPADNVSSSGELNSERNKSGTVEEERDKSETANVEDESSLTAYTTKKSRKETVAEEDYRNARKDLEVLNEEETANLMPKLVEIRALEKSTIYSDDSTWESLLQNSAIETPEQKKPNTGLALLEETYKKEIAKSRKLKARRKKKKQLQHLLESVNKLTPEEEELPLSVLYIKKLQQKRDLLNSLDQNAEGSSNFKAQKNVDEVINAVAENRVENLGVDHRSTNDNQIASGKVADAAPLGNDQLNNSKAIGSTSNLPRKDGEEALASSGEITNETDFNSDIGNKAEDPQKVKSKIDDEVCRTNNSAPQEKNVFPEDTKLSSGQSSEVITSHDSPSKIKKSVPQNSVQSNASNNENESATKTLDDDTAASVAEARKTTTSNSDSEKKIEEPSSTSPEIDTGKREDTSKAKIGNNQKHISQTAQQALPPAVSCEKKDEKVRNVGTSKTKTAEKCIKDESVTDVASKKSNFDVEDSVFEKIAVKREQHQKLHSRGITEKLDRVAQVESSKGSQKTRKESDRSRDSTGEDEYRQYHGTSQSSVNDELSSRKLHKRRRGNVRAPVRRSTRYTEETTKCLKAESDGSLESKEHLGLTRESPMSLSSHEDDHDGTSSNSKKNKASRKRPVPCELETSSSDEPNANSLASADCLTLQDEPKHVTKKRKLKPSLRMMNCEVRLVDSRFTILRPDANPDLLRKYGISTINQFAQQRPVQIDLTASTSQPTSEDVPISETILISPTIDDTSGSVTNSIKRSEDASKSFAEQSSSVKIKNVQKPPKLNPLISEVQDPELDVEVVPILAKEQVSMNDVQNLEKPEIEIVEEKKSEPNDPKDDNDVEFELSITEKSNEKDIPRTQYTVHKGPILDIKVFGNSFLAASEDGTIYRYSQASNGILNIYKGHKAAVTCLYVYSSRFADLTKEWMFSGSLDGTLRCYNITTGKDMREPAAISSPVQCMDQAWGVIFIGTKSGHVLRYHIKSGAIKGDRIEFSEKSVLALKATNEGPRRVLIVASRNQPITIRDAQSGLFLRTICGQRSHTVYSLMRDHNLIYCGTSTTSIPVYDFTNGEQIMQYDAGVGIVCMRLYQRFLFAGCYDGNIYVFDTKDHRLVCSIPGPGNMLLSMEIVDDKIIAGSKDKRLQSWQMPKQVRGTQQRIS